MTPTIAQKHSSGLDKYFHEVSEIALLDAREEKELARAVQDGDIGARDQLIRANLRLVVTIARQFAGRGVDLQDLIEEGNLGLVHAAERFDPDVDCQFSTYASHWIRQSIQRVVVDASKPVRIPMHMAQMMREWQREAIRLEAMLHWPPSEEEIAQALELSRQKLKIINKALKVHNAALSTGHREGDSMLVEELTQPSATGFELALEHDLLEKVVKLVNELEPREAAVIRLRYGLDHQDPMSLAAVGAKLGLSRDRIRQFEKDAMRKLYERLEEGGGVS